MTATMRVLEWAPSYGIELCTARLPTGAEKSRYVDWFRDRLLIGVPDTRTPLKEFSWSDLKTVFGDRRATHAFPSCSNHVWILQPGDEDKILAIEAARRATKAGALEAERQAEADHITRITETARATGIDQRLNGYLGACDGTAHECSSDWIETMVRPDGSTYQRRTHTH